MKVPVSMIPAGGSGAAIAAFIAIALVVFYLASQTASVPPQNPNAQR